MPGNTLFLAFCVFSPQIDALYGAQYNAKQVDVPGNTEVPMPVSRHDDWIQIAALDLHDQIHFTPEFLAIMSELDWGAKKFVGHLLGLWYDPFEHMLDYTSGDATATSDQPGTFDCNGLDEPQDVVEYWAESWSRNSDSHEPSHLAGTGQGLSADWHRDVLRAKLVSLRLPRRLLEAYRDQMMARQATVREQLRQQGMIRSFGRNES